MAPALDLQSVVKKAAALLGEEGVTLFPGDGDVGIDRKLNRQAVLGGFILGELLPKLAEVRFCSDGDLI